jgi:mRNA interferase RelE/StbE
MKIAIARDPAKILSRMQPAKAEDIRQALDRIAADPAAPNNNLRPLKGVANGFRLRVGDWRVSYTLDRTAEVIDIFEIAERRGLPTMKTRHIPGISKPRIRAPGTASDAVRAFVAERIPDARLVGADERADYVILKPDELEELIENALAEAAFARTRDQERVPIELVDRLLAGEHPVRV